MRRSLLFGLALILCFSVGLTAQKAQKFGHVSTAALLEQMPEVKTADAQLSAFQEGLVKGGESKVQALQQRYTKLQERVNNGEMSKVQQAQEEQTLREMQDEITQYEQQVQFQVMQKREELLKPILQSLDEAIQAVGKEGGYTFIFDTSAGGALLYAMEGQDVTAQVKTKLGLP